MESSARQTAVMTMLERRLVEMENGLRETRERQRNNTGGSGDYMPISLFEFQVRAEFDAFTLISPVEHTEEEMNCPEIVVEGLVSAPNDPHLPLMSYPGELW